MAQAIIGAGVDDEASAIVTNVFGVQRVVIPVAGMPGPERRQLRERLTSELDAVRDLIRKAELYSGAAGVAASAGKDGRLFAPEAAAAVAVEDDDDGCRAAKRRKVSPFAERATESKRDDRERLAGRLASMAAALPDHLVAFLLNRRAGDADSRGDDGEIEMDDDDVQSMKKDGALFQLKTLLAKFAPESTPKLLAPEASTPKSRRGGRAPPLAASGISCLSQAQHQEAGGRMPPLQEEEEEQGVNICGGVSRIAIRDIAEEYGELVDGVGVLQLLSPLHRRYADLDEQDMYVDICGDASPVVFPAMATKTGDSSSSDSDATSSTDSDSSSTSTEALPNENSYRRAGEPVPAPEEAIRIAEPGSQCAAATVIAITKSPPAPMALAQPQEQAPEAVQIAEPPEPAPVAIQIAEPESQCAAATVFAITKSPPAPPPTVLAQPQEQAPEAVQIAEPEPEELKEKCVAPAATAHPITGGAPPPAVLPKDDNGASSQPAPVPAPAPVVAQIAEPQPQEVQNEGAETNELIAKARQEWKRRAMARARQKLLEMEKKVLPDERIHPRDMELLGIPAFQHVVSTVRDPRTAQPQVDDVADLRVLPGRPSILQQLGVFLKPDDDDGEEEDEVAQRPPPLAVASGGEDMNMEIEEGQIL